MESDGAASSRRQSGGGGVRSEHSSSTQGVYVPRVGEDREGVAPKCHCGVYAIPYLSRTESNPNRMFFGCPFFKGRLPHCKFFMWLDVFTAKMTNVAAGKIGEEEQDVREQFGRIDLEKLIHNLDNRVAILEKKNHMNLFYVITMFVVL
ncbi:hypothetical protein PIB30_078056, partial [Stylosanthes scabra]|nr:hypothetical protein [Stylosanthes scabra]